MELQKVKDDKGKEKGKPKNQEELKEENYAMAVKFFKAEFAKVAHKKVSIVMVWSFDWK